MAQKVVVITGASDGIGAAAARQLALLGEKVVVVGRSAAKTAAVAHEIDADFYVADFTDLSQVRHLAQLLANHYPRIDVLANNAGGIMGKREVTVDGYEKTLQVNHLAPFLLTTLLMETLISSRASVIQTSSVAARLYGRLNLDDLQLSRHYSAQHAYGNAKLANILFTRELHRRYAAHGIAAAAFHPGIVATQFASETTNIMRLAYHNQLLKGLMTISPERGATQLVWLAIGQPGVTWASGEYYRNAKVSPSTRQSRNPLLARSLWEQSEALTRSPRH